MAISILTIGNPITGTENDDFILPRNPQGDNIVNAGGGRDVVLGDAISFFRADQDAGNGAIGTAFNLDDSFYWTTSAQFPLLGYAPAPVTSVLVETTAGEAEYFYVSLTGSFREIEVDVDFFSSASGTPVTTAIDFLNASGSPISPLVLSDGDVPSTANATDAFVHARFASDVDGVWIRVRPADSATTFSGDETFVLNILNVGHAANGSVSFGADTLNGEGGDDSLFGGPGSDVLNGGSGNDTLVGGYDGAFDTVHGDGNNDTIWGSAYGGALFGDDGNDRIVVDYAIAAQTVDGGAGVDTLDARYLTTNQPFRFDMNTGVTSNPLQTFTGFENYIGSDYYPFGSIVTGTDGANVIRGNFGVDTIDARGGNDIVAGGRDADTLDGGLGIDTLDYSTSPDGVVVLLSLGFAFGGDGGTLNSHDTFSGFENVTGSGGVDAITGNAGRNTLSGLGGDDTMAGDAGDDTLIGGDGADVLYGGAGADVLSGGAGIDLASYADAPSAVSVDLRLTAAQETGGGGKDRLSGIENLTGSDYADTLTGSATANVLKGGAGNDTLRGSGGDTWTGGAGADRFTVLPDSSPTARRTITITDFSHAEHDHIFLTTIDADTTRSGVQHFRFIGTANFTHTAGELRYVISGGSTLVYGDTDGDAKVDLLMTLTGGTALVAADFVLAPAGGQPIVPDRAAAIHDDTTALWASAHHGPTGAVSLDLFAMLA